MGTVRDRQQITKRLSLPNMQVQLASAATSDETARIRTSGGVTLAGRNQQQTPSRSVSGHGANSGTSNQASQSDNVMTSSTEHRGQETSNRKPTLTVGPVNKAEQRPAEPLKPPPRRKFKNAISAGDSGKKGKSTQSAESDSHRQETTPRVDVSTTSDQTGSSCDDGKINSTTTCTADSHQPQVDDNNSSREVTTTTLESDRTRCLSQSPQKNSILKKSTTPSKPQSVLPNTMTQQRLQRQMINQQKRARQRGDAVDPNSTNSPRRVLFKNNVSVYRFDVDSNNVVLEDHVDGDDIRLGRRNGEYNTATISPSVPSPGGQAVPRSPPVTMTTMQELVSDYDKKRANISRLHVTNQPFAPKGRLIISDKFPTLTNANQDSPNTGIYGQDQQQMWWQHDANEQFTEAGFDRGRQDSYDPTLTADGHWIADESNRKTVFFVLTSSSPPNTADAGSLQNMSNKTTAGRRLISSNHGAAAPVAARSTIGDNADDDCNNIPQLQQQQQHLLRRQGVTNHLPSHRESSNQSSMEPLRQPGGFRRLMIAFKLPLNDADGGQPFTADSLLVKANRDGCRVRVVSMTSPRSANLLPAGVQLQQQRRRGQNSADSARDVNGGWTDADYQLNEQLNLPYAVDPYRVVARLEPDSTLVIEAPIVESS